MPQSIHIQSIETLRDKFENKNNENSNKYRLKTRFELGQEVDTHEFLHTYLFNDALDNSHCTIVDIIQDKLHELTNTCKNIKKPISNLILEYTEQKNCTIDKCIEDVCGWDSIEW